MEQKSNVFEILEENIRISMQAKWDQDGKNINRYMLGVLRVKLKSCLDFNSPQDCEQLLPLLEVFLGTDTDTHQYQYSKAFNYATCLEHLSSSKGVAWTEIVTLMHEFSLHHADFVSYHELEELDPIDPEYSVFLRRIGTSLTKQQESLMADMRRCFHIMRDAIKTTIAAISEQEKQEAMHLLSLPTEDILDKVFIETNEMHPGKICPLMWTTIILEGVEEWLRSSDINVLIATSHILESFFNSPRYTLRERNAQGHEHEKIPLPALDVYYPLSPSHVTYFETIERFTDPTKINSFKNHSLIQSSAGLKESMRLCWLAVQRAFLKKIGAIRQSSPSLVAIQKTTHFFNVTREQAEGMLKSIYEKLCQYQLNLKIQAVYLYRPSRVTGAYTISYLWLEKDGTYEIKHDNTTLQESETVLLSEIEGFFSIVNIEEKLMELQQRVGQVEQRPDFYMAMDQESVIMKLQDIKGRFLENNLMCDIPVQYVYLLSKTPILGEYLAYFLPLTTGGGVVECYPTTPVFIQKNLEEFCQERVAISGNLLDEIIVARIQEKKAHESKIADDLFRELPQLSIQTLLGMQDAINRELARRQQPVYHRIQSQQPTLANASPSVPGVGYNSGGVGFWSINNRLPQVLEPTGDLYRFSGYQGPK